MHIKKNEFYNALFTDHYKYLINNYFQIIFNDTLH